MWPLSLFKSKSAGQPDAAGSQAAAGPVAQARIDRKVYPVTKLDRATVTIDGVTDDLVPNQRFHFAFRFNLDGEDVEVPTSGTVLNFDGGQLVAKYLAPQPYYQKIMRRALAQQAA